MSYFQFKAASLALCVVLSACGGGGSDAPEAPKAPASTGCSVHQIKLLMFGDSTFVGFGASVAPDGAITYAPAGMIQRAMDVRFGAGAVQVLNYAVAGTNSTQLRAGTDGVNAPWPAPVPANADLVIVNHGINDEGVTPLAAYRANLTAFASIAPVMVIQTPSPTFRPAENAAYAQVGREVAAAEGVALADVHGYVSGVADPAQYFPDGIHPNDAGYQLIVNNVTLPALMPLVAKLRCE